MKLGEYIHQYRKAHRLSMDEFSERSNISKSYISFLEKNEHPKTGKEIIPSFEVMKKVAVATRIDIDDLIKLLDDDTDISLLNDDLAVKQITAPIPLYSSVSCGTGLFVDDVPEDFIAIPDRFIKRGKEYFAMPAKGDSMIGKGIVEGDILVFEKTQSLENGQIGCFCVDNNCAVCKVYRVLSSGAILLESANNKYDPIEVDILKDCFRIIGKYICRFTV